MKIIKGIFKFVILSMLLIILNVLSTFIFAKLNTMLSFGSDCYFVNNEIFALISQIVSLLLFFLVPIVFYPILIRLQSIKLINTFFFDYEDVKKYFIIYAILDLPIFIVLLFGIETGMLFTNYLFYISWLHSYLVFFLIAQYKKSKYSKNNNAVAYSLISFIILCFILCYGHFYKDLHYEIVSIPKTSKIVKYNEDSKISKLFSTSFEINKFYAEKKDRIIAGDIKSEKIYFTARGIDAIVNPRKYSRSQSVKVVKLLEPKVDDNYFYAKLFTTYAYKEYKVKCILDYTWVIDNNYKYKLMQNGYLSPHFIIIDIKKPLN